MYKKIPEHVLGRIAVAVSFHDVASPFSVRLDVHYIVLKKPILILFYLSSGMDRNCNMNV